MKLRRSEENQGSVVSKNPGQSLIKKKEREGWGGVANSSKWHREDLGEVEHNTLSGLAPKRSLVALAKVCLQKGGQKPLTVDEQVTG